MKKKFPELAVSWKKHSVNGDNRIEEKIDVLIIFGWWLDILCITT